MAESPPDSSFDALMAATTDGVAIVANGTVVRANDALASLLDRPQSTIEGTAWRTLFVDDHERCVDALAASEPTSLTLDGDDDRPVAVTARAVDDATVANVTDRTPTVERDRYRRILENVNDGIYQLDADGRIEYVNQAALDAHDISYDRDEILGEFATALLPADDVTACVDAIRSLIVDDDATSEQVRITIEDADGTELPAELNLSLLPADDGAYAGSVGILRDVSERRRRDQMLRVLNRILRHNVRNDMNIVAGIAQLVDCEYPAVDETYTDSIQHVAEELVELGDKARVVEALTDLETGAASVEDVVPIVDAAVENFAGSTDAERIAVDAPASADAFVPPLFEVAVENVVQNALDHGDATTVDVDVTATDDAVTVSVSDDGPGIPDAEVDALRAGMETSLEHSSDLGLWLTDWIVTAVDGKVSYDASDGTTVVLSLPIVD